MHLALWLIHFTVQWNLRHGCQKNALKEGKQEGRKGWGMPNYTRTGLKTCANWWIQIWNFRSKSLSVWKKYNSIDTATYKTQSLSWFAAGFQPVLVGQRNFIHHEVLGVWLEMASVFSITMIRNTWHTWHKHKETLSVMDLSSPAGAWCLFATFLSSTFTF